MDSPSAGSPPAPATTPLPPGATPWPDEAGAEPTDGSTLTTHFLVGFLAPLLTAILFLYGHGAMNQSQPEADAAGAWYMGSFLVGAASAVAVRLLVRGPVAILYASVAAVAAVVGLWAGATGELYGFDFFLVVLVTAGLYSPLMPLVVGILGIGVASGVAGGVHGSASAGRAALAGGAGVAAGYGGAAVYHLLTLSRQEEMARQAHEVNAPGAGFIVLVAALLVAAAWRRRS